MAGFLSRLSSAPLFSSIQNKVKEISSLGIKYDDLIVKNSQAIGSTEAKYLRQGVIGDEALMYSLAMSDTTTKKYVALFDKEYPQRREFLRKFSMNGEIQWILDTLADEAIIQDERQFFCYATPLSVDVSDEVIDAYEENFKKIYSYWRFNDDITAWQYFYQLLVDGFLAFEIIYNEKGDKIIGFKELDPLSLRPAVEKQADGTFKHVWHQYENDINMKNTLYDSQVIYISYAKGNSVSRVSYVERLIRSFNLMRIMEHTRVIWAVMNASFRLKMVVPIGSKSPQKARESLGSLMSIYKEDVRLDNDSGELFVNGRPNIQFYKNYMFPSKNGESPDISVMGGEGPDLSDTGPVDYFFNKLKLDSKIPMSRFDRSAGGGQFSLGPDGVDREEIRFSKFVNRLRSIFQEIITKPLYLQMVLDFPELRDDELFKSQVGVRFNKDNIFERMKEIEVMQKSVEFINTMSEIKTKDDKQYFHPDFLIERWMFMSNSDIEANKKKWKEDPIGGSEDDGIDLGGDTGGDMDSGAGGSDAGDDTSGEGFKL